MEICIFLIFPFADIDIHNGIANASTRYANKTNIQNSLVYAGTSTNHKSNIKSKLYIIGIANVNNK